MHQDDAGRVEILHSHTDEVQFLSSDATKERLSSLGLHRCHKMADMGQLVREEARDNPDILRYHASSDWLEGDGWGLHKVLRRSAEEGSEGGSIEDYAFDRYVSQ